MGSTHLCNLLLFLPLHLFPILRVGTFPPRLNARSWPLVRHSQWKKSPRSRTSPFPTRLKPPSDDSLFDAVLGTQPGFGKLIMPARRMGENAHGTLVYAVCLGKELPVFLHSSPARNGSAGKMRRDNSHLLLP